jgi:hypothetical protein
MTETDKSLRDHVLYLLRGGGAHVHVDDAFAGLTAAEAGMSAKGVPYTLWQLLEHMRIAQWDILEFSRDPAHVSPEWPEEYWPKETEPSSSEAWGKSMQGFRNDLEAMERFVADPSTDLFARISHGTGQTILREALLIADHNAYHLGQVVLLRKLLGRWSSR